MSCKCFKFKLVNRQECSDNMKINGFPFPQNWEILGVGGGQGGEGGGLKIQICYGKTSRGDINILRKMEK